MKKFKFVSCTVILFLAITSMGNALTIQAGDRSIWEFDFSSVLPTPPYGGVSGLINNVTINFVPGFYYVQLYDNYPSAGELPIEEVMFNSSQLSVNISSTTASLLDDSIFYLLVSNEMDDLIEMDDIAYGLIFSNEGGQSRMDMYPIPDNPVPEPGTILLFCLGLLGLAGVKRRGK